MEKNNFKIDNLLLKNKIEKDYSIKIENNYFSYIENSYFLSLSKNEIKDIEILIKNINKILLKWYNFYYKNINSYLKWDFSLFIDFLDKDIDIKKYLIWRYDVLMDEKWVFKIIEINANTPWMISDVYKVNSILKQKWYKNYNLKFVKNIKDKFKDFTNKKIWILLANSFSDEDFLVACDYKEILKNIVWEENIIIWDIYETNIVWEDIFTIKWKKIDLLLNFCPLEFFITDLDFANSFLNLIKENKLNIYNCIESIVLQDKILFAIIYENLKKFSKKEQEIIKKHIPFTTTQKQEEDKYLAKYRWWRISRWTYEKNFDTNIQNIKDYVFQEKIISKKIDENWKFIVWWFFTNLDKLIWIIARTQEVLITDDNTVKIVCVYGQK